MEDEKSKKVAKRNEDAPFILWIQSGRRQVTHDHKTSELAQVRRIDSKLQSDRSPDFDAES